MFSSYSFSGYSDNKEEESLKLIGTLHSLSSYYYLLSFSYVLSNVVLGMVTTVTKTKTSTMEITTTTATTVPSLTTYYILSYLLLPRIWAINPPTIIITINRISIIIKSKPPLF